MKLLATIKYDLDKTLLGGQSHSWDFIDNKYYGFTNGNIFCIESNSHSLSYASYQHIHNYYLKNYLRLDTDIIEIQNKISSDEIIRKAIKKNPTLRVLKQDFEETLLVFILTQHKNIKAIRKSLRLLTQKFGKKVSFEGKEFYLFPKTEVIAEASIEDLQTTGIGFRAKYLKAAAEKLVTEDLKSKISNMNEEEARGNLIEFYGVGNKVADCVLSFSLGFDNVTPLDVWSLRILTEVYGLSPKMKYEDMRKWTQEQWNGYAAWAGHYLWEWYREL